MHLRIGTEQNYPDSYAEYINSTWIGKGVSFDLINYIRENLKFTYSIVVPEDSRIDSEKGILGLLNNGKVDLVASFLHKEYFESLGFPTSVLLGVGRWAALMKRPSESSTGSGLTAPFDWLVWLVVLSLLAIIGPVFHLVIKCRGRLLNDGENEKFSIPKLIWFAYGSSLKQGSGLEPRSNTTRILFATWWIYITVLTAFYTANLTAFLTLSKFTLPINSPKDIGTKHYKWATSIKDPINFIIKDSNQRLYNDFKGAKGQQVDKSNLEIIENYVQSKNYIFVAEDIIIKRLIYSLYKEREKRGMKESRRCNLVMTPWKIITLNQAFVFAKNFSYVESFSMELLRLNEAGISIHKRREGLPSNEICPLRLGNSERKLRNSDLLFTYYSIIGGYVTAIFVFMIENILIGKCSKSESEKEIFEETGNDFVDNLIPPPPSYQTLFGDSSDKQNTKLIIVNGREYWVVKNKNGKRRMIPARSPSALIFHKYS